MNPPPAPLQTVETADRSAGLAGSIGDARPRRPPDIPDPLILDHRMSIVAGLELLARHGQAIAFVSADGGQAGVVTAEDLRFAGEWAGHRATVAHAVTQALIDIGHNETVTPTTWKNGVRP